VGAAVSERLRGAPFARWLPLQQIVRHGSKAVTRHRRPMHFLRQKLMAVTKYVPPKPAIPERCIVPRVKAVDQPSGLIELYLREVEAMFQDNKMIALFQDNAINSEDMVVLKFRLQKYGIHVKCYPNQILRTYLSRSQYQNLLPLVLGKNLLFISKEPKVWEMLKVVRTTPQVTLLGACIEDTILSKQGVLNYSRLPSMAVIRGEVVSGLMLMTSQTCTLLQGSSLHLTLLLQQYLKQQSEGATTSGECAKEELTAEGT
uniref:Large ribosomal subunit protein uL10m n=1 Tax=Latimeria chalumnae TaxID=7897 RepID=H3BB95_LATCH